MNRTFEDPGIIEAMYRNRHVSFADIGRRLNITRQTAINRRKNYPGAPTGATRIKTRHLETERKRRAKIEQRVAYKILKSEARRSGFRVINPKWTGKSFFIYINDDLCICYHALKPYFHGEEDNYLYFRFSPSKKLLSICKFAIFICGDCRHFRLFKVPSHLLANIKSSVYIPKNGYLREGPKKPVLNIFLFEGLIENSAPAA